MRLHSIKLSGFKSFVDPTTLLFSTNLTAVVGPNGCGKSNIIDAIRWVMGESSAKQLRGGSLDDVIFNGSATRKPISHASVELNFDNSLGTLTGQYASYSEIGIRREITRDGQSNYYLNGGRCRRKDIIDIFLGTGLGPRSYAIIEQGMISRLIEAKPEEVRNYIEEAAGISKYKERRHETELRIQHTEENLARLNDLRDELTNQLNHLQRQANAAERYKVLKQEERTLRAQLLTHKWQSLEHELVGLRTHITDQEAALANVMEQQKILEEQLQIQQSTEATAFEHMNEVQTNFYQVTSEVSQHEQMLLNQKERQLEWEKEQTIILEKQKTITEQIQNIEQQIQTLEATVSSLTPQQEQAAVKAKDSQQILFSMQEKIQEWQMKWDIYNQQSAQTAQRIEVEQTRIQQLKQNVVSNEQRILKLTAEQKEFENILVQTNTQNFVEQDSAFQEQQKNCQQILQDILEKISAEREQSQKLQQQLDDAKNQLQTWRGKEASLEALQQEALGQREEAVVEWLKQEHLAELPRLAQLLEVATGWEQAVETVLERHLQAVCLDDFTTIESKLSNLTQANISFVKKGVDLTKQNFNADHKLQALASKVQAPRELSHLLTGIYLAENFHVACEMVKELKEYESVITQEGIWMGKNWIYVGQKRDTKTGVLQREKELTALRQAIAHEASQVEIIQRNLQQSQDLLHTQTIKKEELQHEINSLNSKRSEIQSKQQIEQAQLNQTQQRLQQIASELQDASDHLQAAQQDIINSENICQLASENLTKQTVEREELLNSKTILQDNLNAARHQADQDRETAHQCALQSQAAELQLKAALQDKNNLQQQHVDLSDRQKMMVQSLADSEGPILEAKEKLAECLKQKSELEQKLILAQQNFEKAKQAYQQSNQERQNLNQSLLEKRNELEQARLAGQAQEVRAKNLEEQIAETGFELHQLAAELLPEIQEDQLETNLAQVVRKIERLGAINLAAIDECSVLGERKNYLDTQVQDLLEALNTLKDAIHKMDQETRNRFKDTYEQINTNFQKLFPSLFGGGKAYLQLNEDDLLVSGVSVMAQPPGKRNSTIHLLSGGEKALTAIALVFSLFQLNPAPFCMLDEVDAPLDDTNIGRFCNLVKQMARDVQFIFISHNKLAIEMAEQLAGVTMHEAGVSRLVAVDVEQAIAMAGA